MVTNSLEAGGVGGEDGGGVGVGGDDSAAKVGVGASVFSWLAALVALAAFGVCAVKCFRRVSRGGQTTTTTTTSVLQQIRSTSTANFGKSISHHHSQERRGNLPADKPTTSNCAGSHVAAPPAASSGAGGRGKGAGRCENGAANWETRNYERRHTISHHLPSSYQVEQRCASGRSTPTPLHRGNWPTPTRYDAAVIAAAAAIPPHQRYQGDAEGTNSDGAGSGLAGEIGNFLHAKWNGVLARDEKSAAIGKSRSTGAIREKKENFRMDLGAADSSGDVMLTSLTSIGEDNETVPSTTTTPTTMTTTTPETEEKFGFEKRNPKLGCLVYSIQYHEFKQMLQVHIDRAEGLPPAGRRFDDIENGNSDEIGTGADPFVKLQILPEKRLKVKTRVLKRTLDPVYDETFSFYGISPEKIRRMSLHFAILSFDRYSHDDVIGEVFHSLAEIDVSDRRPSTVIKEINPKTIKIVSSERGQLLISLCHQRMESRLVVGILKAKGLPAADFNCSADTYVKLQLTCGGQKNKKKTDVKKRTTDPVFNQSFIFDVPNDGLKEVELKVTVCCWDGVSLHCPLGSARFALDEGIGDDDDDDNKKTNDDNGNDSTLTSGRSSINHFVEVQRNPRKTIARWHTLSA